MNSMDLYLEDAAVEIKGRNSKGQEVTVKGAVYNVVVEVEYQEDKVEVFPDYKLYSAGEPEVWIRFKVKEGKYSTFVSKTPIKVTHTARIEAADQTAKAVEEARLKAGVPEHAKFRFDLFRNNGGELTDRSLDKPTAVTVEFMWEETQ